MPVAARDFLHGARCAKSRGKTLGDVDGCVTFSLAARRILTRSPVHPPQSETVIVITDEGDVGDGAPVSAPTSKKVGGLIDFNVAIM